MINENKKKIQSKHITEENSSFRATLKIDALNQRIWVEDYGIGDLIKLTQYLLGLAHYNHLEKIIFPCRREHVDVLKIQGYVEEGILEGYFSGQDAHFMATFPRPRRGISLLLSTENQILQEISERAGDFKDSLPVLSPGFNMRKARQKDVPELCALFKTVFDSYPSPVQKPEYLSERITGYDVFRVITYENKIVSAASVEIDPEYNRAELTDCATLPEYRGRRLMNAILHYLERDCHELKLKCLFTLARASSYGMNLVFHRLGYKYKGTLINNCHICGQYEDMNLWVKIPV